VSAHYNSSENFNAAAAGRNLYAEALPFPSGKTKEWGVSLYNGKFSLRFAHFKTDQLAATINFPGQTTLWQEMANIYHESGSGEYSGNPGLYQQGLRNRGDLQPDQAVAHCGQSGQGELDHLQHRPLPVGVHRTSHDPDVE
jgi:hypothetical protein